MTKNAIPDLTMDERMAALECAIKRRKERAVFVRDVKEGKITLADALVRGREDKDGIGRIRVERLLRQIHGVGEIKAKKVMHALGIAESRRLYGLGCNQREALVRYFS